MNIEQFRTELIEYFKVNYEDFSVEKCDVVKNNNVKLHGIVLKKSNTKVLPSIYLESYFMEYMNGSTMAEIAEGIINVNDKNQFPGEFDENFFLNFDNIKPLLFAKIINTKQNSDLLKSVPNRQFLDLSIVAFCDMSSICGLDATILIRNEHIKYWNIDEETLISIAYENSRSLGTEILDMKSIIERSGDIKLKEELNMDSAAEIANNKMYVFMSKQCLFGAVCMTFDDRLDEAIKLHGGTDGIYILPSSIHETIIIFEDDNYDREFLNDMIESVNRESLSAEEVLSDHAYYYTTKEGYNIV